MCYETNKASTVVNCVIKKLGLRWWLIVDPLVLHVGAP